MVMNNTQNASTIIWKEIKERKHNKDKSCVKKTCKEKEVHICGENIKDKKN